MMLNDTERIDLLNIGLMLLSACIAIVLPFELFLFVYAILGPLHYLTEISWLHDRNYFTKGRYDAVWLLLVGIVITLVFFRHKLDVELPPMLDSNLMFIGLASALIFVTVKNPIYKIGGIVLVVFLSQVAHNYNLLLTVFVPTLIHVYLFTFLFMLYGVVKSKSRVGPFTVLTMVVVPVLLCYILPDTVFFKPSAHAQVAYRPFAIVNVTWLQFITKIQPPQNHEGWVQAIFYSSNGVLLMRFIAFAYTYHYLNWFSKTKVIQWHNIPRLRFIGVLVLWAASVCLYLYDYMVGIQWLLFLSFMHVLLELPLNFISIIGIGKHFTGRGTPTKA